MKTHTPVLRTTVSCLILLLLQPVGTAADSAGRPASQSAGAIAGRVQNVATGQFLNNVRVAVKDTDLAAFTDQTGTYRLSGVPSGPLVLEVFFTGLDAQRVAVTIRTGETLDQDFNLTSASRRTACCPSTSNAPGGSPNVPTSPSRSTPAPTPSRFPPPACR